MERHRDEGGGEGGNRRGGKRGRGRGEGGKSLRGFKFYTSIKQCHQLQLYKMSKKYFQESGHDSAEEQAPSVPDYVPTPIGEERGNMCEKGKL